MNPRQRVILYSLNICVVVIDAYYKACVCVEGGTYSVYSSDLLPRLSVTGIIDFVRYLATLY
jgi:hypothetical protein